MKWINDIQSSYIILSSRKLNELISILYGKDYQVMEIKGYYNGNFEDSVVAWGQDNESLRRDLIFLLNLHGEDSGIVKYQGESNSKKVSYDGSERELGLVLYNTDPSNKSYLYEGLSFSFIESKKYWTPKSIDDIKSGMIVEYLNNNKWYEKIVVNPQEEWDKMYKLLLKYNKLRISA